jgi:hypothetical protein
VIVRPFCSDGLSCSRVRRRRFLEVAGQRACCGGSHESEIWISDCAEGLWLHLAATDHADSLAAEEESH